MRNGRPLRFLALTLGGWTALRTLALWQAAAPLGAVLPLPLVGRAEADPRAVAAAAPRPARLPGGATASAAPAASVVAHRADRRAAPSAPAIPTMPTAGPGTLAAASAADQGVIPPPLRPTPLDRSPSRLAGSAWLIARGGGGTLLGGQLGGSQAGARLTYALGGGRRVALSARIATPLGGLGREAAIGVDWQPTRAAIHLIAEQRLSLDGGRGGPVLMAVGGLGPVAVAAGFRLEAYGEAGAIARGGVEGFGDGAARLTRRVARIGGLQVDAGAGGWGAIQRGARRLDVGPTLGAVVPLGHDAHYRAVRLTLDWRERVAGDARPDSGPALSLGTDF